MCEIEKGIMKRIRQCTIRIEEYDKQNVMELVDIPKERKFEKRLQLIKKELEDKETYWKDWKEHVSSCTICHYYIKPI